MVQDLEQDDIDDLFGNEAVSDQSSANNGIKILVDRAMESYKRLPMLEVIYEKFMHIFSTNLRNLIENNVDIMIKDINSMQFYSYIKSIPVPTLVMIFKAKEWNTYGLLVANNVLIFTLVEILFGGRKMNRPSHIEGRPYTGIEQNIVEQLTELILDAMSQAFDSITTVNFVFEKMETDPRFASIARQGDHSIMAEFNIEIDGRKGGVEILFPYESLKPVSHSLSQVFMGDQVHTDEKWKVLLEENIRNVDIVISAIMEAKTCHIQDIINLKIGSTIMIENNLDEDINLFIDERKVLSGKLVDFRSKKSIVINKTLEDINKESSI